MEIILYWYQMTAVALTLASSGASSSKNMTVISPKGVLLSVQETNCTSKEICNIETYLTRSTSYFFSPWSNWSKCKKTISGEWYQTREKQCKIWDICQKTVLKEEKPCRKKKKKRKRKNKSKLDLRKDNDGDPVFHIVRIPSVMSVKHLGWSRTESTTTIEGLEKSQPRVYSKWSRWTMCSKSCLTQRYRWCKKVDACGNDVIRQTAYCYTEGSHCESWLQEKFSQEAMMIETTTESKSESQQPFQSQSSNSLEFPTTETIPPMSFLESPSDEEYSCGIAPNRTHYGNMSNMLRIIGGRPTSRGKWPWIVAVLNRFKEAFCGGTLVSGRWVLTAAHCVRKRLYVSLGEYDLNRKDDDEIRLRVRKAVIHPKYNVETVDNDLALLYLPSTAHHQRPACLPRPRDHLPFKQMCTIVGWGKQSPSDQFGTDLLHEAQMGMNPFEFSTYENERREEAILVSEVEAALYSCKESKARLLSWWEHSKQQVPIVARGTCKEVYTDYQITGNMFCAGYRRGRMDSCSGDSGGPLLCQDSRGRWTVFGITSFGEGCGKRGKYGIYTRLPNYARWIQRVINTG